MSRSRCIASRTKSRARHGFSLIEMAVILVILGLILATVLPRVVETMEEEVVKGTRTDVQAVRDEVIGYAIDNCALPTDEEFRTFSAHAAAKFGGTIYYYYDGNLTKSALGTSNIYDYATSNDGMFTVTKAGEVTDDVAFIVGSKGRNNAKDFTPVGNSFTITAYEKGVSDDMVAFATLDYIQSKTKTCEGGGGNGGSDKVSFESNMGDFSANVGFTTSASSSPTITVNQATKTVSLGNDIEDGSGCLWYQGSTATKCSNGNCTFGDGVRALFEFQFSASSNGDGFAFGFISGDVNNATSCGGNADFSQGELLAWAGDGVDNRGIAPPKLGIEFDTFRSDCRADLCAAGSRCDYSERDHIAYVYWGDNDLDCGGGNFQDDNRHGAGDGSAEEPYNDPNSDLSWGVNSGQDGYLQAGSGSWLENASEPWLIRIEVIRGQAPNGSGNYDYELRAWLTAESSMPVGFGNLTADYAVAPQILDDIELTPDLHNALEKVYFGWTQATGEETQTITVSNFELVFR